MKKPQWLLYAIEHNLSELKPLPQGSLLLSSDNGISQTWRGNDGFIYKRSIPFLIQNEIYCLRAMYSSGYVPHAVIYDRFTIKIEDLGDTEKVTNKKDFMSHKLPLKYALVSAGVRHGDLTSWAIIIKNNHPYIIDFAESRLIGDPRPDKRPEGDDYWVDRTWKELCS